MMCLNENKLTKDEGTKQPVPDPLATKENSGKSARSVFQAKGTRISVSAKARSDEGTLFSAIVRFPLLFLQWPYLGGVLFYACILLANIILGDRCDDVDGYRDTSNIFAGMLSNMQDVLICSTPTRGFSLGEKERIVMWLLSVAGVLMDIIPKYLKGGVAQRHLGQRTANRALLFHIISGTVSVLGNGLAGMLSGRLYPVGRAGFLFPFLAANDLFHQLSILLLTKNHDGTYALRLGNLTLSVYKFVVLVNSSRHSHESLFDIWFTASFMFLGTRVASTMVLLAMYLGNRALQNEDWYSIGLASTQVYAIVRNPGERVFFYVIPISAYLFYHELWDKAKKPQFVAWNVAYSVACLATLNSRGAFYAAVVVYYYLAGFGFHKKRFYRWPEHAFKGASKKEKSKVDLRRSMARKNSTWMTSFARRDES